MSSEGDTAKDLSSEVNKSSEGKTNDSTEESDDKSLNDSAKMNDTNSDIKGDKSENESKEKKDDAKNDEVKSEDEPDDEKDDKNEGKTDNDTEDGDDSDKDNDKKGVALLDQPLEQSGTRERKKVNRFNEEFATEQKDGGKLEVPQGTGTLLGEIPRIDASIARFKNDDLKLLHRVLFKTAGKTNLIKKNIKKFNGFDFKKDSEEYTKKLDALKKFEVKQLKSMCEMLDVEKKGNKDEIAQRIMDFLVEPKDSGKLQGGGRPKRTAAVRANNRGYSSHDDSYSSDEKRTPRSRGKGKRTNLKDDSTSESDEEFHPSDEVEGRPRVVKRKKVGRKRQADSDEENGSEVDSPSSDDSDVEPKKKKKAIVKKVVNNKKPVKTTGRRGRKPASETEKKATPAKRSKKRDSSEESEKQDDNESSSEDEPLIKKAKSPQPPTDEEIKKYVKGILDGANLEEITMKTVCKQVYAHYPDFDLAHKKDFIKSTVKSLIST